MSDIIVRVDGWDLVKDGGQEEPRIRDFDLAERLQYRELKAIRKLIKRLIDAGFLPNICVRDTVSRTQMPTGGVRETVDKEYLLTEAEALLVISRSETEASTKIMQEVIDVYIAVRRGLLAAPNPAAELALVVSAIQSLAAGQAEFVAKLDQLRDRVDNQNHTIGERGARAVSTALATYSLAIAGDDKKRRRSVRGLAETTLRSALKFNGVGAHWSAFPAARWPELKAKLDEFDRMVRRSGLLQMALPNA